MALATLRRSECFRLGECISKEKGVEHFQIFDKSVNEAKFIEWLAGLKAATGSDRICLFLDNLTAHKTDASGVRAQSLHVRSLALLIQRSSRPRPKGAWSPGMSTVSCMTS